MDSPSACSHSRSSFVFVFFTPILSEPPPRSSRLSGVIDSPSAQLVCGASFFKANLFSSQSPRPSAARPAPTVSSTTPLLPSPLTWACRSGTVSPRTSSCEESFLVSFCSQQPCPVAGRKSVSPRSSAALEDPLSTAVSFEPRRPSSPPPHLVTRRAASLDQVGGNRSAHCVFRG